MISPIPGLQPDMAVVEQDKLANTLFSLQSVIERKAIELARVKKELKANRESLKSVFDNDDELRQSQEAAADVLRVVKERKSKMQVKPEVTRLKVTIGELNEEKKELEESLSDHLVNYHTLTNSSSFDTSDGDQCEFEVRAKVTAKQLSLFTKNL